MTRLISAPVAVRAKSSVRASELESVLDLHPRAQVLSLDCFDTILWRRTAAPVDIFYDLANHPEFSKLGLNAKIRVTSEATARSRHLARTGKPEVGLTHIYRTAFPELDDAAVKALSDAEVAAEIEACAPLASAVALIRRAREKKLRIVIVSDTYFTEEQLRRLLAATLPEDAYRAIDRVFCSSAIGRPKADGMFGPVLRALGVKGKDVLHVGDNLNADVRGAEEAGIRAVHLLHHEGDVDAVLRMQTTAASLLMPSVRDTVGLPSPFRAVLASASGAASPDPTFLLGYASLGPILFAFGRWLAAELAELRATHSNVKPVFLMRDGYLPSRIFRIVDETESAPLVSMSRFAATAAAFRTASDIESYVADWAGSHRFADIARQLLFTDAEARALVDKTPTEERFMREIMRPENVARVIERSARYRERLFRHLEKAGGIAPGDTVVFVDLGYEGTAQKRLAPVFADEKQIRVLGRYLIAARVPGWETSRRGLLDPSWCDDRLIGTLVTYVALLELLCASDVGSTVDYDEEGNAVLAESLVAPAQSERVKPIQAACEAFARDAKDVVCSLQSLRVSATASLARMSLLPTRAEIDYLRGFALDMNLGVDDRLPLFDIERGLEGLRRSGLFSLATQGKGVERIAAPVELRAASLELALTAISQERFSLEMATPDMTHRRESVGLLVLRGKGAGSVEVEAQAMHDGWFAALVPLGECDALGFQFGQRYGYVQVDSVTRIDKSALLSSREDGSGEDASAYIHLDGMTPRGDGLFECVSKESILLVAPPREKARGVLRIVFRPIVRRG